MEESDKLTDDLLSGGDAIADYTGLSRRRVYYLIALKALPARKLGPRSIVGLKSEIDAALGRRPQPIAADERK